MLPTPPQQPYGSNPPTTFSGHPYPAGKSTLPIRLDRLPLATGVIRRLASPGGSLCRLEGSSAPPAQSLTAMQRVRRPPFRHVAPTWHRRRSQGPLPDGTPYATVLRSPSGAALGGTLRAGRRIPGAEAPAGLAPFGATWRCGDWRKVDTLLRSVNILLSEPKQPKHQMMHQGEGIGPAQILIHPAWHRRPALPLTDVPPDGRCHPATAAHTSQQ